MIQGLSEQSEWIDHRDRETKGQEHISDTRFCKNVGPVGDTGQAN